MSGFEPYFCLLLIWGGETGWLGFGVKGVGVGAPWLVSLGCFWAIYLKIN